MNTPEQLKQAMAEAAKQRKAYDENSVPKAREKWLDARDRLQALEASGASMDAIYEARQAVSDREKELETAQHFAGHYAAAAQYRKQMDAQDAQRKQQEEKEQAQFAKEEEERTKGEMLQHWLASGGTSHQFYAQWSDMWRKILADRSTASHDPLAERLAQRYAGIRL